MKRFKMQNMATAGRITPIDGARRQCGILLESMIIKPAGGTE
jgi:hypothetical protein